MGYVPVGPPRPSSGTKRPPFDHVDFGEKVIPDWPWGDAPWDVPGIFQSLFQKNRPAIELNIWIRKWESGEIPTAVESEVY